MNNEKDNEVDIVDNIIKAISLLNNVDEYLEGLNDNLSKYDSIKSDFEHIIELNPKENINLEVFYDLMREDLLSRRKTKNDMNLGRIYGTNVDKLKEKSNRLFLIQNLKNAKVKSEELVYSYRVLSEEQLNSIFDKVNIQNQPKKKRGRPRKCEVVS